MATLVAFCEIIAISSFELLVNYSSPLLPPLPSSSSPPPSPPQVPAKLHHEGLKHLQSADSDAVDQLLKRKCIEQGLYLGKDSINGTVLRSRSSEALRKISLTGTEGLLDEDRYAWRRSRSLSDTQKTLDEAIRNLEQYMNDELTLDRHGHYSSNDSAMGESEAVLSPLQARSEPSTLCRNRRVYTSVDSAFSNNSSPTNSSEGGVTFHSTDLLSYGSDSAFAHTRMSSNVSGASGLSRHSVSPTPGSNSPELTASPCLGRKGPPCNPDTVSLSALSPEQDGIPTSRTDMPTPVLPQRHRSVSPVKDHSAKSSVLRGKSSKSNHRTSGKMKWKVAGLPPRVGTYSPRRSPILNSKIHFPSEPALNTLLDNNMSSDHTPTDSTSNLSCSAYLWDPGYDFEGVVI